MKYESDGGGSTLILNYIGFEAHKRWASFMSFRAEILILISIEWIQFNRLLAAFTLSTFKDMLLLINSIKINRIKVWRNIKLFRWREK